MPGAQRFAARVVLAGAPDDAAAATVDRLRDRAPDLRLLASVIAAFQAHGFCVGPVAGFSFGIEGDRNTFKEAFGVALGYNIDGSIRIAGARGGTVSALPLTRLPPTLRARIRAVLFSAPPASGPT